MREVTREYGVDLFWTKHYADQLNGHIEGPFIRLPEEVQSGTCYFLSVNEYITAYVTDVTYNQSIIFHHRNKRDDFVLLHFDFTEGEAIFILDEVSEPVGRWEYNLAFLDSSLDSDYVIKEGSKTYSIDIFVSKEEIKRQLSVFSQFEKHLAAIFDPEQNTIIRFERSTNKAWWIIEDLRNADQADPLYEILLRGTVYYLLSDYMEQTLSQEVVIEKVVKEDLVAIIDSQSYLIGALKNSFPGIKELSDRACMSETKYKALFKKITGNSPNSFFLQNKLFHAREMLAAGQYTIAEVADQFNFTSASHFTDQFKNCYGLIPTDYLNHI